MIASPARSTALRVALVVALLPWLVQPGVIQPDTKVDLVVSPWRYLARALDAWSTHSAFGELQNQAYGYLFPMGPFFGVLHTLGVPGWAAQRAWWSFILVIGFLGAALVARRMARLSVAGACLTGVAYALSARVLTLLSELSVETWPGMLMPWLVLAVWWGWRSGRHVRLLAASGVLVACLGGVNATASLVAVLGAGLVALAVTRDARVIVAYTVGAVLGSAWWLGPLVVLGGYAYPFMDFIETSRITTAVTTLPAVLRGASDWVAYIVDADGHPVWQSGWVVAQGTLGIVAGSTLAGLGLAGLLRTVRSRGADGSDARVARRVGLGWCALLVCGVLAMALPYAGMPSGPLSQFVRDLLDGPLAAMRNVHKFDPLVRLPLVIGLGAVWDACARRRVDTGEKRGSRAPAWATRTALVAVLVASLAPFLSGRLGDANGVRAWPNSLVAAARDLDAAAARDGGTSLVLPSARTAQAEWGSASDEPLTAFAASPVAVRASAPLYHPGAQRLVDAIDTTLARGRSSSADAERAGEAVRAAARAGVRRIVVRWGTASAQQTSPPQAYVAALSSASGVRAHRVHGSADTRYDVFELAPESATTGEPVAVLGGPESTLSLAGVGLDASRPFVTGRADGWITDDVRRHVYNNGQVVGRAFGPTLAADDPAPERLGARDLDFDGREASSSVRVVTGASRITATSSTADPFAALYLGPGTGPDAAFDGSAATRWLTRADQPGTLRVQWRDGAPAQTLTLVPAASGGARVIGVGVVIDGRAVPAVADDGRWSVDVPAGSRSVELTPHAAPGTGAAHAAVGLSEVTSTRPIESVVHLPGALDGSRNGVVMTRSRPWFDGHALASEDDGTWCRAMTVTAPTTMTVKVTLNASSPSGVGRSTVWMRSGGGAWTAVSLRGSRGTIRLPAGEVNLKASPDVERLTLSPTSSTALERLGLSGPGAGASEPTTLASTQGANAGWALTPSSQNRQSSQNKQNDTKLAALDGWRQGATGAAPSQRLAFSPAHLHRGALVAGAGCAVACLILVVVLSLPVGSRRRPAEDREPQRTDGSVVADASTVSDTVETRADAAPSVPRRCPRLVPVAALTVLAALVLGWAAVPVMLAALAVPRRRRALAVVALMVAVGPLMAALGVVDKGSVGAVAGQVLTGVALAVFGLEVCRVPSGWRVLRRSAN